MADKRNHCINRRKEKKGEEKLWISKENQQIDFIKVPILNSIRKYSPKSEKKN